MAKKKTTSKTRGGSKAELSKSRGHKPVAVLESFHAKMAKNFDKLGALIERRKASGE